MVTGYDYPSARFLDAAGVDAILVGDSLGNVVQGKSNTLGVTLGQMIYHAEMVVRATSRALVVVDVPFPYAQQGPRAAVRAAAQILKRTAADAVKIEGGAGRSETIRAVVEAGIPVLGHCGLKPQDIKLLGGYSLQRDGERLIRDVEAVQEAGAFGIVLECIPTALGKEATEFLKIPTIGIGAGPHCDGQVLVYHDLLGFGDSEPKHAKAYVRLGQIITEAVQRHCEEVRDGAFPEP